MNEIVKNRFTKNYNDLDVAIGYLFGEQTASVQKFKFGRQNIDQTVY